MNLLSRFLYHYKSQNLEGQRRFQIHSGFIFEDMVKRDLAAIGFQVTEIKRINRKEFDVVTVLGEVIYNFQCKNNCIDLMQVTTNKLKFIRYNRRLDSYYRKALAKEKEREGLLFEALGLSAIEHFVISRFPVITDNPYVIPYNRLDCLIELVANSKGQ